MNITILSVEKHRTRELVALEEEFIKRLSKYCKVVSTGIKRPKISDTISSSAVCNAEGEMILKKVKETDFVVALDSSGTMVDSKTFALQVKYWQQSGKQSIVFIIGGPHGLAEKVKTRANFVLSLSKLTFSHEIARMLLCEALYRVFDILQGGKYHK